MKTINLFGNVNSKGTYDDFFDCVTYATIQQAYIENNYVEGNFVEDNGKLYIHLRHSLTKKEKLYKLMIQQPIAGLDCLDDKRACKLAEELLKE